MSALLDTIEAINPEKWTVLDYLVTIHELENEGGVLLIKEGAKKRSLKRGERGWEPKKDSTLHKQLDEALNEHLSPDKLFRKICIVGGSVCPALIIALICNNRDNGKLKSLKSRKSRQAVEEGIVVEEANNNDGDTLKSKRLLRDELQRWPIVYFKALIKRLMTIPAPTNIRKWCDERNKKLKQHIGLINHTLWLRRFADVKAGEDEAEIEDENRIINLLKGLVKKENTVDLHPRKRRREEYGDRQTSDRAQTVGSHIQDNPQAQLNSYPQSQPQPQPSQHGDSLSAGQRLLDPAQRSMVVVGSHRNENPHAQLYHDGELDRTGYERFKLSVAELNECLLYVLGADRRCHVEKIGSSPESTVRVDPLGKKQGLFLKFRGQTAKNLAKRAVPPATSKDLQFSLPFTNICDHILELVERREEEFDMVYCQGFATFVISPDYELVTFLMGFKMIKAYVKQTRATT